MPVANASDADDDGGKPEPQEVHAGDDGLQDEQQHGQDQPVPDPEAEEEWRQGLACVRLPTICQIR